VSGSTSSTPRLNSKCSVTRMNTSGEMLLDEGQYEAPPTKMYRSGAYTSECSELFQDDETFLSTRQGRTYLPRHVTLKKLNYIKHRM